jgi:hypothetical protein
LKKLAVYYLFLLYAAAVCKPLSIWFADVLAHSYSGHQHLGVVHQEDGKDHVHYQIGKAAGEDIPAQKQSTPKSIDDVTVATFVEAISRINFPVIAKCYQRNTSSLCAVFLPVPAPPPWS